MTDLTRLDGPGAAAVREQLVAVYRAAMGAAPFFETEVETGWFAEELADELDEAGYRCWVATEDGRVVGFADGFPTPEIPSEGWYGLVREAVGPAGSPSSGSPSTPTIGGRGWAGACWSGCWPRRAPSTPG